MVMASCIGAIRFNPFPNKPCFLRVCSTSLLKTQHAKEKLLVTSNFSFSRSVFYPFGETSVIFIEFKIVVCNLFHFGILKFVVLERFKRVIFAVSVFILIVQILRRFVFVKDLENGIVFFYFLFLFFFFFFQYLKSDSS